MLDDDAETESVIGPPSSTAWIENEVRRLYKERLEWQTRWYLLKDWIDTHRHASDVTTVDMIAAYMSNLETITPAWTPKFISPTTRQHNT